MHGIGRHATIGNRQFAHQVFELCSTLADIEAGELPEERHLLRKVERSDLSFGNGYLAPSLELFGNLVEAAATALQIDVGGKFSVKQVLQRRILRQEFVGINVAQFRVKRIARLSTIEVKRRRPYLRPLIHIEFQILKL